MAGRAPVPILRSMTASGPARPRPGRPKAVVCSPWVGPPRHRRPPAASTPGRGSADGQVLGALLILTGVGWLLRRSGVDVSWQAIVSVLLLALGAGMVLTSRRRGGPGLVLLGATLALVLLATSSVDVGLLNEGVGDRTISATTFDEARRDTLLGIGQLDVNLSEFEFPDGRNELDYRLGLGHLVLRLPPVQEGTAVRVEVSARGGKIELPDGRVRKGPDLEMVLEDKSWRTAQHRMTIDLGVGFGFVQVVREGG